MSSSRSLCPAYVFTTICLLFAWSAAFAQGIPAEAYRAKTVFIRNNAGGAPLENAADEELSKWGRFSLADDEASADIILVFSKNGAQNKEARTRRMAPAAKQAMAPASRPARRSAHI